jgi:hypothetical protein
VKEKIQQSRVEKNSFMIKDKNTVMKNKVFCHFLNNVKSELLLNPFRDAAIPKNTPFCSSPLFPIVEVE